jgi:hypothetical protein
MCYCEVIPDGVPVKVYGDIDIGGLFEDVKNIDYYIKNAELNVKNIVLDVLSSHFENPNIHFAESTMLKFNDWETGVEKWKFHYVFIFKTILLQKTNKKL